jgi:hypothetical protein
VAAALRDFDLALARFQRLHRNVLAIALANKLARIAWAVLPPANEAGKGEVNRVVTSSCRSSPDFRRPPKADAKSRHRHLS